MATQITNYKCPACTGPLHFVGASGKLECDYCGSAYDVARIESLYADAERKAEEAFGAGTQTENSGQWSDEELERWGLDEGMKAYACPSCGAELICDETTAATACPYCGNPSVIPGQFSGGLKPDCIIPFKLSQEDAKEALKRHYSGKRLLPRDFAGNNKLQEIRGVYVPFWLFDGQAHADAVFAASNSRVYRRGNYEITETAHYRVRRAGIVPFEKIPVDASSKMPDDHMDAIEPFDYRELRAFSNAYLPGFLADKYDVSIEESAARADERATNTAVAAMREDVVGYGLCVERDHRVTLQRDKVHYGLLPVYLLGTMWKGERYLFAMNGQTGKLIGNLPVDKGKYWAWFGGITAGVTAVLGTILMLLL